MTLPLKSFGITLETCGNVREAGPYGEVGAQGLTRSEIHSSHALLLAFVLVCAQAVLLGSIVS